MSDLSTLEAQLTALYDRHAELTAALSVPRTDNSEATRVERQAMRDELQGIDAAIPQAELALVAAELDAQADLRALWAAVAEQDRAAVVEALATVGHRGWRAVMASGGNLTFRDWLAGLYPEIEGQILDGARSDSELLSGPITDAPALPEALELSPLLTRERRAALRGQIALAG